MSTLKVTIKEATSKGVTSLQGSYQLPGSSVTKLQNKEGSTSFATRATLNQTARKVATTLGWELQYEEPAVKAAAKKSLKPTATKKTTAKKLPAPVATKAKAPVAKTTTACTSSCSEQNKTAQ